MKVSFFEVHRLIKYAVLSLTYHWPFIVGWILIDRCGKHFGTILNYLRDGAVPLPDSRRETEELLAEAKYYLVQGLADECTAALQVPSLLPSVPKSRNSEIVSAQS